MLDHVFRPGAIGGLALPHRIVMGAMHLNLEDRGDGGAALAAFYAERARGGAGLIVSGGAAVDPDGAGGPGYSVLTEPGHRESLARAASAVHAGGGRIALQLFHAGRYALPGTAGAGEAPLAPSPVYSRFSRRTPREMDEEQIRAAVAAFARGAEHARALGFDAVEVMGSEGYLINQFTAPATNRRTDGWGGSREGRLRFPVAVLRAVREAVGREFPVLFRMSGADLVEGGTPHGDVVALAAALAEAGADALDVGVGWHESPVPTVQAQVPAGSWARVAQAVKRGLREAGHGSLPVVASNRINRLSQAEEVLAGGDVDFVSMARPFLADPEIVARSRSDGGASVNTCIACNEACIDRSFGTAPVSCLVNPRAGQELRYPRPAAVPAASGRPYAVVGAGPAGLEAALALARLGHRVRVFEAAAEPGGQFRMARRVPGKEEFGETVRHHVAELQRLGAELHLGRRIGFGDVELLRGTAGAVLATGVLPRRPELPGYALPHVVDYQEAFADPQALGRRVAVVGGGGVAVDLALLLTGDAHVKQGPEEFLAAHWPDGGYGPAAAAPARPEREVTLVRRTGRFGAGIGPSTRWVAMGELRGRGVRTVGGVAAYREITREGLVVSVPDPDGGEGAVVDRVIPADSVVLAAGQEPERGAAAVLRAAGVRFETAGGAAGTERLNAVRAADEGLRAAYALAGA